ncbi:MAG: (Fe-S)-binding protein [Chloroflexi bacterium]|nr:(Fe-S)-binding protein [Chloroflexota bacterium]
MTASAAPVKASLFVTCVIDQLYPEVGESAVRVLRRLGVDLDFPRAQTCCGQPAFNSGYWSDAKPLARRFLKTFGDSERYIVVPSGSCASMLRVFYAELLHDEPALLEQARAVASRVYELSEFIVDVLGVTDIAPYTERASGAPTRKVTYHEACHLRRELGATTQPRALISAVPGVELVEMDKADVCCGFGGTFSVKYADISAAMLQDKINAIRDSGAEAVVACDSSCLMQLSGGLERQNVSVRPLHLAQLLDEALTR